MKTELNFTDFFYCYDLNLHNYLKSNGVSYIIKAKSILNNKIFTMYEKTERVKHLIAQYEMSMK